MKNVLILGAAGQTMHMLEQQLADAEDVQLTLFVHRRSQLQLPKMTIAPRIVSGDVLDTKVLKDTLVGQDAVVVGLSGQMASYVKQLVPLMNEAGVERLIYILGLGIHDEVPGKFGEWNASFGGMKDFKQAAEMIMASNLNYTILRPAWMSDRPEINYETTGRDESFRGTVITRASIADYIVKLLRQPTLANRDSIGLDEPGTDGDSPYPFM